MKLTMPKILIILFLALVGLGLIVFLKQSPSEENYTLETQEINKEDNMVKENTKIAMTNQINIQIGDKVLTATLIDNSSVDALKKELSKGPIVVNMRDYSNMEKVGSLGMNLPRNDQQITTEAGDLILFQGSSFVIYYAPNSWNFTRLGKIDMVGAEELKEILGSGDVTITLSLFNESIVEKQGE